MHTVPYHPPPGGNKIKVFENGEGDQRKKKKEGKKEKKKGSYNVGSTKRQHFNKTIQIFMNKTQKLCHHVTKWGRKSTIFQTCGEENQKDQRGKEIKGH